MENNTKLAMIYERSPKLTGGPLMALVSSVENNKVVESPTPRMILPGCEDAREGTLVLLDEEGQIAEKLLIFSMGKHKTEICQLYNHYKSRRNSFPPHEISEDKDRCSIILVNLGVTYTMCKSLKNEGISDSEAEVKSKNKNVVGQ